MRRKAFERHFSDYRRHLHAEIRRFRDCIALYRHLEEQQQATAVFQVVHDALFTSIVLWGDKLLDERGQRGLFNFLTLIEYNCRWLTPAEGQRRCGLASAGASPIDVETIEADRQHLRSLLVQKSLHLRRDKFHGHFDRAYFFDRDRLQAEAPIQWTDLQEAGELMANILNAYSIQFDGILLDWTTLDPDDLEALLDCARQGKLRNAG